MRSLLKYLVRILAVLVVLAALVYMVGWLLPVSHTAQVTREFEAARADVFAAVTRVGDYPSWRRNVREVEILSGDGEPLAWREYYTDNGPITFAELERADSTRFASRIVDANLPFGGQWTYLLEEAGGAGGPRTRLTIVEDGQVYNPLFRFVSRFVMGHTATMEAYMKDLEEHLGGRPDE